MRLVHVGAFALDRAARTFEQFVAAFPGYEDFVRLTISAAVPMLFPYCQLRRGHVAVDLLVERMPRPVQRALDAISLVGMTLLVLFLLYWMVIGMAETRADHAISRVLGWPEWPFYPAGTDLAGALALVAASMPGGCCRAAPLMIEREIVDIVGLLVLFVLLMLRIPVGLTMIASASACCCCRASWHRICASSPICGVQDPACGTRSRTTTSRSCRCSC